MLDINSMSRGMPLPQTGATQYHAQLLLSDKGRVIKGLVVCNNCDLEPLDLPDGLALGCYQPSSEVFIVLLRLVDYGRDCLCFLGDYLQV